MGGPADPAGGSTVSFTTVPLGPRMSATIFDSGMSETSTGSPAACATAMMRSPGARRPLFSAGLPGTSSRIVQTPSSLPSAAPMPNSERFISIENDSISSWPR